MQAAPILGGARGARPRRRRGVPGPVALSPGAPIELAGRRALVIGLARTGVETARFLAARGALVTKDANLCASALFKVS